MMNPGAKSPACRRRGGVLSVEMLFLLPLLMLFVLAIVQFGMMLHARQQLSAACREAARTAALGGDAERIRQTLLMHLGDSRLSASTFKITDKDGRPVYHPGEVPPGEPIEVWVECPVHCVVPDLLGWTGYSIKNDVIVCRTVMRKE